MAEDFITYEGYCVPKNFADQLGLDDEGLPLTTYDETIKKVMGQFFDCPFAAIKNKLEGVIDKFYSSEVEFVNSFNSCTTGCGLNEEFVLFMQVAFLPNNNEKAASNLRSELTEFFAVFCDISEKQGKVSICEENLFLFDKEQAYVKEKNVTIDVSEDSELKALDKQMEEVCETKSTARSWTLIQRCEKQIEELSNKYNKRYIELRQELVAKEESKREKMEVDLAFAQNKLQEAKDHLDQIKQRFTKEYIDREFVIR